MSKTTDVGSGACRIGAASPPDLCGATAVPQRLGSRRTFGGYAAVDLAIRCWAEERDNYRETVQRRLRHSTVGRADITRRGRIAMLIAVVGGLPTTGCNGTDPREDRLEAGEEYGYILTTHCGIEWARIGGSWWRTEPLNDGNANPPTGWDNPSHGGRLRIEDADSAVFTGGPEPIVFVRTELTEFDDPSLPDSVRFCD